MFEMAGLCLKGWGGGLEWWAHVRKDRLVFEMVGNDGVVVRNDWLVFERVGLWFEMASSHSKGWGCV